VSARRFTGIDMEKTKTPGFFYACTDDGLELPVLDVTNPAFAIETSPEDIAERTRWFVAERQARRTRSDARRAAVAEALRQSRFGGALKEASGSFLDSITTYLMKLGPDHLGTLVGELDRHIAASFPIWTVRLRVHDVARLLADGLNVLLEGHPGRPVTMVDVAGGTAIATINALLLVRQAKRALLDGRTVAIRVFDAKPEGPGFGGRALAALSAEGAPLHGLDARFEFIPYDWNDTAVLARELERERQAQAIVAVSSEGGLFDYGSDDAIRNNLRAIHTHAPSDAFVVGSVARNDGVAAEARETTNLAVVRHSLPQFSDLATAAGWQVEALIERPFTRMVRLQTLTRDS
jgi:hypothetical protein